MFNTTYLIIAASKVSVTIQPTSKKTRGISQVSYHVGLCVYVEYFVVDYRSFQAGTDREYHDQRRLTRYYWHRTRM